jgi:hypothetical protein
MTETFAFYLSPFTLSDERNATDDRLATAFVEEEGGI